MSSNVIRGFDCEAVLFDLDGVLVDSTCAVERAWRRWAERRNLDAARVLEVAHGRRTEEVVRLFVPHLDAEAEAEDLERAEVQDVDGVLEVDGAADLLAGLPAGCWTVVTSGTRALATTRMRHTGLPVPPVFVCAEDVVNGKPAPECYLKGAKLLKAAPERCLVVEDAPAGIRAAKDAGMAVIAVATTHPASELSYADAAARSLSDVRFEKVYAGDGRTRLKLVIEGEPGSSGSAHRPMPEA